MAANRYILGFFSSNRPTKTRDTPASVSPACRIALHCKSSLKALIVTHNSAHPCAEGINTASCVVSKLGPWFLYIALYGDFRLCRRHLVGKVHVRYISVKYQTKLWRAAVCVVAIINGARSSLQLSLGVGGHRALTDFHVDDPSKLSRMVLL